jgi:hypothetical protein
MAEILPPGVRKWVKIREKLMVSEVKQKKWEEQQFQEIKTEIKEEPVD